MEKIKTLPKNIIILLIVIYRKAIRPFLGYRCRFHPSCLCYALDAIKQHGCLRGCYLIIFRILRCHPFSKGGHDPVPD